MCSQSLSKRACSTWSTSLSWSTFCHRRLMSPWRGGCVCSHPPMQEIVACVTHGLRCKYRTALTGLSYLSHKSPLLLRWQDVPSLGDWQNVRLRKWRDWGQTWTDDYGAQFWDGLVLIETDKLRDMQGQWTGEKLWRTGTGWAGAALRLSTQDRRKHRRLLQQQTKWLGYRVHQWEREKENALFIKMKRWGHQEDKAAKAIKKCRIERNRNSGWVLWGSFKFHDFHPDQGLWLSRTWLIFVVRQNQVSSVV